MRMALILVSLALMGTNGGLLSAQTDLKPGRWARQVLVGYHQLLLSRKPEVPAVTSLDLVPSFGWGRTGMRLTASVDVLYGLYGSGLRVTRGMFPEVGFTDRRSTVDWQVLVLHPVHTERLRVDAGTGLVWNTRTNGILSEQAGAVHVYGKRGRWSGRIAGRYARRKRDGLERWELQGGGLAWFLRDERVDVAVEVGAGWRSWNDRSDALGIIGLQINIH